MKTTLFGAAVALIAAPALAEVVVRFDEGAPKDRFTITNEGTCPLGDVSVVLDLGASSGGLIFDVTATGAGISVFQPLELVAGLASLMSVPEVRDGDTSITLPINTLDPGQSIVFTIDVDDTNGTSATTVSGSEIMGGEVRVGAGIALARGSFSDKAVAVVSYNSCTA
ncbi:MAG: aggregation factor core [Pseudomonadota bacterium]